MSDIIKLLPDHVASQIAAGEVIQRPSSVVKELLENAVDAKSKTIKLYIKDGGKTLIQINDDGVGMSETDARMCWERHATSKLNAHDDLYKLQTMGFRGEALASIASIAHVELKTCRAEDEIGTSITIEGSTVINQEPIHYKTGTSISVKNLFYNVPARRNFLKSNPVETKYIIDEFTRVALARPDIAFELYNNEQEVFKLQPSNLVDRFEIIFPDKNKNRFIEANEETPLIKIEGYIGSPQTAKKNRGEQFLYINKRYFKDAYLNHAIVNAYDQLLQADTFPSYIFHITIDPARIDVNVHPAKTEIKFEDEKIIYQIMRAVVRKALGQYIPTPTLDYNSEPFTARHDSGMTILPQAPRESNNFDKLPYIGSSKPRSTDWKKVIDPFAAGKSFAERFEQEKNELFEPQKTHKIKEVRLVEGIFNQLLQTAIIYETKNNIYIIDQHAAHARVLYEQTLYNEGKNTIAVQQKLFPKLIELNAADFVLLTDLLDELLFAGFDIAIFGKNTLIVNGTPADLKNIDEKDLIEGILNEYKNNKSEIKEKKRENLARSLSKKAALKHGQILSTVEMQLLTTKLFECKHPTHAPDGTPVFINLDSVGLLKLIK